MNRSPRRALLLAGISLAAIVIAIWVVSPSRVHGWFMRTRPLWYRIDRIMAPIRHRPEPDRLAGDLSQPVVKELVGLGPRAAPILVERLAEKRDFVGFVAAEALAGIGRPAIPELLAGLKHHRSEVRAACARVLSGTGDPSAVPGLLAALDDSSPDVRDEALWGLVSLASKAPTVVPALERLLRDPDPAKRRGAAQALGLAGDASREVVPALLSTLDDSDAGVRAAAAEALGNLGQTDDRLPPALVRHLADPDVQVGRAAASALGKLTHVLGTNPKVCAALAAALARDDAGLSAAAANALGASGAAAAGVVPELVGYLADKRGWVRRNSAQVLRQIGQPARSAVVALRGLLEDADEDVRDEAALAVACLDPSAEAVTQVAERLGQGQMWRRRAVAEALGSIGPQAAPAVPALTGCLRDGDPALQLAAVKALGKVGPAAASSAPALLAWMRSQLTPAGMHMEGMEAGGALGQLGPEAAPALLEALSDPAGMIRYCVTSALLDIGAAGVPALVQALDSPGPTVGQAAADVLTQLGPLAAPATPVFRQWLADRAMDRRCLATRALGAIGPKAAAAGPELLKLISDPDACVSMNAILALGEVAYAEAGPALLECVAAKGDPEGHRTAAIAALGKLGYRPAIPALKAHVGKGDAGTRVAVGQALCRLGAVDAGVPELVNCLRDPSPECQRRAAAALGEAGKGARAAVPELTALTTTDDLWLRATAAAALLRLGEEGVAVPILIGCLNGNWPDAWDVSARALGECRIRSAESHLRQLLARRGPCDPMRRVLREALDRVCAGA